MNVHVGVLECSDFPRNSDFFSSKFIVNEIDANPVRSQNALWGGGGNTRLNPSELAGELTGSSNTCSL